MRKGGMAGTMHVFDRATVRRHRDRAAAGLEDHDFLLRERLASHAYPSAATVQGAPGA